MNLTITGRNNLHIARWLEDYIEKKVGKLDRYLPSLQDAKVDITEEAVRQASQHYVVQVTLHDKKGTILRSEERGPDVKSAVDVVVDKLHRQIVRFKGKRRDRYQRGMNGDNMWGEDPPFDMEEAEEEEAASLVRTKRFTISPMNVEEAIEQMDLLGHTFFVFYDADVGSVQVVYRRQDGNYGLIVPELA